MEFGWLVEREGLSWPPDIVCEIVEERQSESLENALFDGQINGRGVIVRDVKSGGQRERERAAAYRDRATEVSVRWPRTAAVLRRLADWYEADAKREDIWAERERRS